jgi:hypothetical protein
VEPEAPALEERNTALAINVRQKEKERGKKKKKKTKKKKTLWTALAHEERQS